MPDNLSDPLMVHYDFDLRIKFKLIIEYKQMNLKIIYWN